MITFTYSKKTGVRCAVGSVTVDVFPADNAHTEATITLLVHPEEEPSGNTISWPGEYEKEGMAIRGIAQADGKQVSYSVEMDDTRIAFLSSPLHDISSHELELFGNVDVLVIQASDAKLAQKLIDEIDPRVLLPIPDSSDEAYHELLNASGTSAGDAQSEYKLKGLPAEGRNVVVLK